MLSIIKGTMLLLTCSLKYLRMNFCCWMFSFFSLVREIFFFFNSLWISFQIWSKSFCKVSTFSCIDSSILSGSSSRCILDLASNCIILFNVATLTLKNSSRLFENIPKNLILSLSGTVLSEASCNTRLLNDNQLMSLMIVFLFCN